MERRRRWRGARREGASVPNSGDSGPRRAITIGGSMAGLFAANLLHRGGWEVAVYERAGEALAERGAGIVTYPQLLRMLDRAGADLRGAIGVPVAARIVVDAAGQVVAEQAMPQLMTSWSRLRRLLFEALPHGAYRAGKRLVGVEQDGDRVVAGFSDGERASADLLIGADGLRSTVRGLLLPSVRPAYAGYVAWRGLVDEAALSPTAHRALFEKFAFCLPDGEQVLGYPVAGPGDAIAPGKRRYNIVWYRPAEGAALQRLLTDAAGHYHEDGIPPHLVDRASVAELRAAARRLLAPSFAEIVEAIDQPILQPIYDLKSPRLVFGRVVLVGDAAFVARPHCGMGVTKAGGDAIALAAALADPAQPFGDGLGVFEAERRRFGDAIVARGRDLGAPMQGQSADDAARAMAERYRDPDAVLADTAIELDW
jgi:2-polyprenyl-6-methoxyphenol hydroxylase-like FAD-dependent oxidoreductase